MTKINTRKGVPSFALPRDKFLTQLSAQEILNENDKRAALALYDEKHAAKATERRKRSHQGSGWTALTAPLAYEIHNVVSGIRYYERLIAVTDEIDPTLPVLRDYQKVMENLYNFFKTKRSNLVSVANARREFEAALPGGVTLPNNGEHWTDWIAPKTKRRIEAAFAAIPYKAKAKRRIPFQRTGLPDSRQIMRNTATRKQALDDAEAENRELLAREATSVSPDANGLVDGPRMLGPLLEDGKKPSRKDAEGGPTSPDHVLRDGRIEPRDESPYPEGSDSRGVPQFAVDEAFERNKRAYIGTDDEHEAFATYAHSLGFRVLSRGVSGAYIVPAVQALYLRWKKAHEQTN